MGGVPEVVRDGENGLLVAPGDLDGLAEAIRRVSADEPLRRGLAAAAAGSVEDLSEPRILRRIVEILEQGGP